MSPARVLAGDVGGTKTLLQIVEFNGPTSTPRVLAEQRFDSRAFTDLTPIAYEFLASQGHQDVRKGCFGVAGPVASELNNERAQLTNLPWQLDSANLARNLGLERVRLINDFQAIGYGIEGLDDASLTTLQAGNPISGAPRLAIGAGTGLGVAQLFRYGDHYEVYPTEAGHMDFAPAGPEQEALLAWLRTRHPRVSTERVVSGPGINEIFHYFLERAGRTDDPLLSARDVPAAIANAALDGHHAEALATMHLFVRAYGSVAGNMALATLARGGIYIAGGIAPKILPLLKADGFVSAFNNKGRMTSLVNAMPVYVINDPKLGLLGAALAARRL